MKNRKGFTLVELLAVIAILAVILLLIVPNIVDMFNNGKKDSFIRQVQAIWREAEKEFTNNLTSETPKSFYCDSSNTSEGCSTLSLNKTEVNYAVVLNSHGVVKGIGVADKSYCYVSGSASSMNIGRDELVSGGKLVCSNNSCTCTGGSGEAMSYEANAYNEPDPTPTPAPNPTPTPDPEPDPTPEPVVDSVVYWDLEIAKRGGELFPEINGGEEAMPGVYHFDKYPLDAVSDLSQLEGKAFIKTTLNSDNSVKKHELCLKYDGTVKCLTSSYYSSKNTEAIISEMNSIASSLDYEAEIQSRTSGIQGIVGPNLGVVYMDDEGATLYATYDMANQYACLVEEGYLDGAFVQAIGCSDDL